MKYDWIFFDLDGTLIDTLPDLTRAMNKALKLAGINKKYAKEDMVHFIGSGSLIACERATKDFNLDLKCFNEFYANYKKIYNKILYETSKPFKGVLETLLELKKRGYHLGVFSNKPDKDTKCIINHYFKDVFEVVRGQVDGIPIKPDKKGYLEVKKKFTIDDNRVLYVGDMINDYEFSKNINCDFFYCKFGYDINHLVPDYKIALNSFKDLLFMV